MFYRKAINVWHFWPSYFVNLFPTQVLNLVWQTFCTIRIISLLRPSIHPPSCVIQHLYVIIFFSGQVLSDWSLNLFSHEFRLIPYNFETYLLFLEYLNMFPCMHMYTIFFPDYWWRCKLFLNESLNICFWWWWYVKLETSLCRD